MKFGYLLFLIGLFVTVFTSPPSEADNFDDFDSDETELITPIELTDETFEHLTQASTGATTGDWFIKFHAPWCGHCKRLEPTWNELAAKIGGKINIAKVNVDDNPSTAERFDVKGFPTLIFLRRGKFYKFTSHDRALNDFVKFATETYASAEEQGNILQKHTKIV
jgi:protein disulfide-isomerase-like protein